MHCCEAHLSFARALLSNYAAFARDESTIIGKRGIEVTFKLTTTDYVLFFIFLGKIKSKELQGKRKKFCQKMLCILLLIIDILQNL